MKPIPRLLALAFVSAAAAPHWVQAQIDCSAVVEATVAELSAGYPEWNRGMEALARTAAGSACVKAAGRAAAAAPAAGGQSPAGSAPMAATGIAASANTSVAAASGDDAAGAAEEKEGEKDGSWHPFKDIKFNEVSARPGKKPYERRRESVDD